MDNKNHSSFLKSATNPLPLSSPVTISNLMISDSPTDLLTIIKSHIPDQKKPISLVRQYYSAFYDEMQKDRGEYMITERVELSKGVYGYWITVPEAETGSTILFFHGGDFTFGSTKDHLGLCIWIARATRAQVFSVDYRLAPEYVFPAAIEDAIAAYRYLISHGTLPHRIIPVGISAGGTLVIDLLLSARDQRLPLPRAGICMSPPVDMLFEGESVKKNLDNDWITPERLDAMRTVYLAGHDPKDPLASPVYARLNGLPRLYIQAGTHELLLSDIASFVDKARWAGVPVQFELWEGMFHCWQMFARQVPEGQEAISHIGDYALDIQLR
jgi:monoterpene epsilon-lactone hydrolase